jgi:phosphate transport system substrate-binding protein
MTRVSFSWLLLAICGPLAVAGCGGGAGPAPVTVDGSSTVFRISKVAQEEFSKQDPSVEVIVNNSGTGGGFDHYLRGEVDIVDASRPAKKVEEEKAQSGGMNWARFLVGYDGITLVVNPKNDFVKSLSVEQLKRLWEPDSTVKAWKDLDPSWPDRKIVLYSPDRDSGTFEFFTEAIVGKAKSQRKDVQANSDDNMLVNGIVDDPDALGYFGYAYFAANKEKLRAVPIQSKPDAEAVAPSPETILSKEYAPLSRPLYIYLKIAAVKRPEVHKFVSYYLEHVARLAVSARYVAPTADDIKVNSETWAPISKN